MSNDLVTKEKVCAFYASDYHFEMITLPCIYKNLEEKKDDNSKQIEQITDSSTTHQNNGDIKTTISSSNMNQTSSSVQESVSNQKPTTPLTLND